MNHTGIIILAAGSASRFGGIKQLLPFHQTTLLQHVIDEAIAAQFHSIVVVTGANAEPIANTLLHHSIQVVYNKHWQSGMASSIVSGLYKIAVNKKINNVIITVCDQPFVTAKLFIELSKEKADSGKNIIASAYADTMGTPVLFTSKYFTQLMQLQGDEGAKKLLKQYQQDVATVPFPQGNIDIDTQEDYELLLDRF